MDDDILQRFAAASRVSLRAVLVEDGEDAGAALAQAGIFDAVAVPVVIGADGALPGGLLGSGMAANLTGTLEADALAPFDEAGLGSRDRRVPDLEQRVAEAAGGSGGTLTLPAAFGRRPMAPVRRNRSPDAQVGDTMPGGAKKPGSGQGTPGPGRSTRTARPSAESLAAIVYE
jgi:hypothetical protein